MCSSDLPTTDEAGLPDFHVSQWWGFVVPARVPAAIVARLHRDSVAALETPSVRERVAELGVNVATSSPDAFRELMSSEVRRWNGVAREAGIRPE